MRSSSSSYYNSSSYSPYGTSSYTTSVTSPWSPRTSSQLRSTMSSPSTSSYVNRTHLPFVPQSTLVAHCFTGVQSSTRPYGYSPSTSPSAVSLSSHTYTNGTSRPSSIRSGNSGYTSSLSRPQSTKRSNYISSYDTSSTSYDSAARTTTSPSPSSSMFESSTKSSSLSPAYKPSSYLSSTTYSTSASTSASRSTHRTRPLTPSSYTYRPIRLRERPVLTHIWRQLNTKSSSSYSPSSYTPASRSTYNNYSAPEVRISEPTTSAASPETKLDQPRDHHSTSITSQEKVDEILIDKNILAKPKAVKEEEWSSDITRVISRNKFMIKFREIEKQRPSDNAKTDSALGVISELEPSVEEQIATKLVDDLLTTKDLGEEIVDKIVERKKDNIADKQIKGEYKLEGAQIETKKIACEEYPDLKEASIKVDDQDMKKTSDKVDVEPSKKPIVEKKTTKKIDETPVNILIPIKLVAEAEAKIEKSKKVERKTAKRAEELQAKSEKYATSDDKSKKPESNTKLMKISKKSESAKLETEPEIKPVLKPEIKPEIEPEPKLEPEPESKSEAEIAQKSPTKSQVKLSSGRPRKASAEGHPNYVKKQESNVVADETSKVVPSHPKLAQKDSSEDSDLKAKTKDKNFKLKLKPVKTKASVDSLENATSQITPGTKQHQIADPQQDKAKAVKEKKSPSDKTTSDGSPKTPESPKLGSKTKVRKVAKRRQSNAATPTEEDSQLNEEPRMHPISPDCDEEARLKPTFSATPSDDATRDSKDESDKRLQMTVTKNLPPQSPSQVDKKIMHQSSAAAQPPQRIRFREYTIDDFNFLSVLGHGGWGFVILAELKQHEACFAVKCIKKITIVEDDDYESILIERKVLALGNVNPFICKLFCTFETEGYLFFVMEFCAGGDLMFHVQRENKFSEPRCRFYAAEIICAIRFLHNRHIIYRDLKLDNILLDSSGHIRLVDFGMCQCRTYREEMLPSNFCGTPEYISPEIIKGVPYNHSVDWWSFGVLLYEMAVGKMPFRGNDENELLWNVCYEQIHYPLFLSRELTILLQQLLEREPSKRMGMGSCKAGDIKDQSWFKGTDWLAIEAMKVKPPFVPCVESKRDVQNFDADFTESQPQLSPVDDETLARIDQKQFQKFPYTNPEIQIFDSI